MVIKTIKKANIPRKKPICKSKVCSQTEVIERMSKILVGNGHPEDGLAFIVRQSVKQLDEIKVSVDSLHGKYEGTLKAAITAQSAFEKYQAEEKGYEAGKESVISSNDKKFGKIMTIGGIIIAVIMAIFTYLQINLQQQSKELLKEAQKVEIVKTPETK